MTSERSRRTSEWVRHGAETRRVIYDKAGYANLAEEMRRAFAAYKREVEAGEFPGDAQSF